MKAVLHGEVVFSIMKAVLHGTEAIINPLSAMLLTVMKYIYKIHQSI